MSAISKYKGKVFDTLESSLPRRSIFVNKPIEEWSFKNYVKHHPRADPATILANMKKDLDWLALCDLPMDVKRHVGTLIKESTKIFIDDVKKWLQSNSSSSSTSITLSGPVDIFTGNSHNIIHKYKTSSKRVASSSKKSNKKARFKEEKPKDRSINNDNNDDRGAQ
ncbi:hypothetical protein BDB00DRAFT_26948 [Zychaea mexicana]|uniref:uncharacterized protein n=1 Tax=Zychaea mexicana TaxID=64656 RepID=UPI0022FDC3B0|nr:uncharacterized protein BDB00DRAFT_320220 [Zychaea mexicana]XP_052975051.1 uncharacterized protein BDB00DRAFT_26948 [Zychaea mexicana]KAI9466522.1 hypothetical protein BDB00DRAFT_320220 [Zychaea mexicana]KAI9488786.1 hypothetical protein BDB00DRAFT_26948 [Zychaea mexicana]